MNSERNDLYLSFDKKNIRKYPYDSLNDNALHGEEQRTLL